MDSYCLMWAISIQMNVNFNVLTPRDVMQRLEAPRSADRKFKIYATRYNQSSL